MRNLLPCTVLPIFIVKIALSKDNDIFLKSMRFENDAEHAVLLETVHEHGLNASQHLIEVQEKELC